jgi:hypothetical protein
MKTIAAAVEFGVEFVLVGVAKMTVACVAQ